MTRSLALALSMAMAIGGCGGDDDRQAAVSADRATASTAVVTGHDRAHGARFSLNGRTLTVTLTQRSTVRGFAGQMVRVDCVSQRRSGNGVARTLRWPAPSRTIKVRFRAGAGSPPLFCSVDTASLRDRSYHADAVLS